MEDRPKREIIQELRSQGKTYREISRLTGFTKATISYHANELVRERFKKYRNKNRKLWYKKIKEMFGGKCNQCGYAKCLAALDFHHPNNNKKEGVAYLFKAKGLKAAIEEAKKCQLLCANCHREVHHQD